MNLPFRGGLEPEFLDDFFSEADAHLLSIRETLLKLEGTIGDQLVDKKAVTDLFQDFHSLKGISAIAGLKSAEALTHKAEDYLRLLRDGRALPTRAGIHLLTGTAQKLVQIVDGFRSGSEVPEPVLLGEQLDELCRESTATRSEASDSTLSQASIFARKKSEGFLLWKATFSPSRELDGRGINIKTTREALGAYGEILAETPRVKGVGEIAFEFIVASKDASVESKDWEYQGTNVKALETGGAEKSLVNDSAQNPFIAPSHVVRVNLNRLDYLMRILGEMVIHRSRLETQLALLTQKVSQAEVAAVQEVSRGMGRSLRQLREAVMRVRLVPVAEIFDRMPFVVRDLTDQTPKKVQLRVEGQQTAIDKYLIERLKDPLLHLVRNAISHGIETAEERKQALKPEMGTIELSAFALGDKIILKVKDDGAGISARQIFRRAKQLGVEVPMNSDDSSILAILCCPGFSTRAEADRAAGRGVGMAVVAETIKDLGGSLSLATEEGKGTEFTLRVPLTLAIAETLIISAVDQTCAIPERFVTEILEIKSARIQTINGIEVVPHQGGVLPVVHLANLYGIKSRPAAEVLMLVVTSERGSTGLLVEKIHGKREVVVQPLKDPLVQVTGISGGTELGDGKPVLILDGMALTSGNVKPMAARIISTKKQYTMASP